MLVISHHADIIHHFCLFGPLVMGVKAHGHWIIYGKNQSIFPAFYGHFSKELYITVSRILCQRFKINVDSIQIVLNGCPDQLIDEILSGTGSGKNFCGINLRAEIIHKCPYFQILSMCLLYIGGVSQ